MKGQVSRPHYISTTHDSSIERDGSIKNAGTMPTWKTYQYFYTQHLASIKRDNLTDNNRPIVLVARTLHEGNWVPGYAINGVGYFVSKELQPFQTTNFQVLIDTFIEFKEFRGNYENVIVADDGVEESNRIKIGSFFINDMRFCGMVDNQNTCYINFNGQIHAKNAPKFQVIVEITPNRLRFRRYRF
ncbi:Hypothetical predicted protein [Cloeon dipterum]|uniref:Uncharacterized protein n=1 Tax=Cloeon dipterum TaxID=197152 RepID=A0A8S1E8R5_9INSE|nr:Hypothetical predicted protein [Cloeon dipterum]